MASFELQPQRPYGLLLATFEEEDRIYALNHVRDLAPAEVPKNSIGILQIGTSQCTAWVVAVPT